MKLNIKHKEKPLFSFKGRLLGARRKKYKHTSLKWKLFMFLILFILVLLILLWLFQTVFLESFYKAISMQSIRGYGQSLAENIDHEEFDTLAEQIAVQGDICISITDGNSYSINYKVRQDCVIHNLPTIELTRYIEKARQQGGTYIEIFDRTGFRGQIYNGPPFNGGIRLPNGGMTESILYVRLVERSDGQMVAILLNSAISPVGATVDTLRTQLIYISLIMTLLSVCVALLISRLIAKPIAQVNENAKELARGNYQVQFQGAGYREIDELNDTLNYAAGELSKVESLREELIANVSHDLRTPLTMIIGYAEMLQDFPEEAQDTGNLQTIIDEAKRLNNLVNDMLDLSVLQAGAQRYILETFDIHAMLSGIVERYEQFVKAQQYHIILESQPHSMVLADRGKIEQVVYNLLNNAIVYTGTDKTVIIRQYIEQGMVRVEVADSGQGVDPELVDHIWERYYRVDKTHQRAVVGSGLGLSIVRKVLEQHHAPYGVINRPGKGCTFWFKLHPPHDDGSSS